MYPEGESCHNCLCTENFNNLTAVEQNSDCRKINCGIGLKINSIKSGCVPVYYNSPTCCPIEYKCRKFASFFILLHSCNCWHTALRHGRGKETLIFDLKKRRSLQLSIFVNKCICLLYQQRRKVMRSNQAQQPLTEKQLASLVISPSNEETNLKLVTNAWNANALSHHTLHASKPTIAKASEQINIKQI